MKSRDITIDKTHGGYTALGYRNARVLLRDGHIASSGSGEIHAQHDRPLLVNQSRTFFRDNDIYIGMIRRAVSYIVGAGFSLQVRTRNKSWNAKAEALWRDFWQRPEIKGIQSGAGVEKMICREILLCGDTGVLKTSEGKIQLFEAEQITSSKGTKTGIEVDQYLRPTKFYVAPYVRGRVAPTKAIPQSPDDFLFLTTAERPSQIRGVPVCQGAFANLHRIKDICDSEALSWQMLARLALSVTRENAEEQAYQGSIEDDSSHMSDDSPDMRITELDYALIFNGEPGDEIKAIERNIPGKDFPQSLRTFLRMLGLPLGLPLELILLDWTQSNYSQSRAVLEQAFQTFAEWQMLLQDFFLNPLYEWKVQEWIENGELPPHKEWENRDWIKPTFPWIDQLKEAQAYGEKVDRGFATHAQVCKALRTDREDVVVACETEISEAIEIAQRIYEQTGVEVAWQYFAGRSLPKTEAAQTIDDNEKGADDDEKTAPE